MNEAHINIDGNRFYSSQYKQWIPFDMAAEAYMGKEILVVDTAGMEKLRDKDMDFRLIAWVQENLRHRGTGKLPYIQVNSENLWVRVEDLNNPDVHFEGDIHIHGSVKTVHAENGNVSILGNAESVSSTNGNVTIHGKCESINSINGDITAHGGCTTHPVSVNGKVYSENANKNTGLNSFPSYTDPVYSHSSSGSAQAQAQENISKQTIGKFNFGGTLHVQ